MSSGVVVEYIRYRIGEDRRADPEFRAAFTGYIEWGSRLALRNSQPDARPAQHAPVRDGDGASPRRTWADR